MNVLIEKLIISIFCAACCIMLVRSSGMTVLTDRRFYRLMAALWGITRFGLFFVTFIVLRMDVTSDVVGYYYPQGLHVLSGQLPYRDFASSYAPGFPYVIAAILKVWNSPKAIVLATTIIDGAGFLTWMRIVRTTWQGTSSRTFAILYVFSSFAIMNVALAGQNQAWVSLILGLAVLLYERSRPLLAAAVAGVPLVLIKFLPLLYIPVFFRRRNRPLPIALYALTVPITITLVLWIKGIDVLQPVWAERSLFTSGNLPYVFSLSERADRWLAGLQILALIALVLFCLFYFTRRVALQREQMIFGMVVLTLICALLNKKFFTNYIIMVLAPICITEVIGSSPWRAAVRFGAFNLAIGLEPSLWFRVIGGKGGPSRAWQILPELQRNHELWRLYLFLTVEVVLLGFYAYYLHKAWGLLSRSLRDTIPFGLPRTASATSIA